MHARSFAHLSSASLAWRPQDAALRKAADDRRAEARLRAEFEKEAAAAERQRQWRIMRGEATAEDLAGPAVEQFGGPARESWMTELPPERQAGGGMPAMVGGGRRAAGRSMGRSCLR